MNFFIKKITSSKSQKFNILKNEIKTIRINVRVVKLATSTEIMMIFQFC